MDRRERAEEAKMQGLGKHGPNMVKRGLLFASNETDNSRGLALGIGVRDGEMTTWKDHIRQPTQSLSLRPLLLW